MANESDWVSEIRGRLFVRLIVGYVAGCWLLLQAADVLGGALDISDGALKTLFVLGILGLPVAAAIGWAYDRKRHRGSSGAVRVMLALALVALGVISLIYLWPDEDLDPDVRRWINLADGNIDYPRNMNYAIWGANAAEGEDPYLLGRHIVNVHTATDTFSNEVCLDRTDVCVERLGMPAESDAVSFTFDASELCRFGVPDPVSRFGTDVDCLEEILATGAGLAALVEANQIPLDRYLSLHDAPTSTQVVGYKVDAAIPPFIVLIQGQLLRIRQAILEAQAADTRRAGKILDDELAFHRAFLAANDSLIAKMIALRLVEWDIRARNAVRQRFPAVAFDLPLERLKPMERSLIRALQLESVAAREFLYEVDGGLIDLMIDNPTYRVLYRTLPLKINATANLTMRPYIETAKASLLDPAHFQKWVEQYEPAPLSLLDWIYNGAGAAYASGKFGGFANYIARVHQLDVLIVLAQLAEVLIEKSATADTVGALLLTVRDDYLDPLTGRRAVWRNGFLMFEYEPDADRTIIPKLRLSLPREEQPSADNTKPGSA